MNAQNPGGCSKALTRILVSVDLETDEQRICKQLDPEAQSLFLELQSLAETVQQLDPAASITTTFDVAKFLELAQASELNSDTADVEASNPAATDISETQPQELGDYEILDQIGRGGGGTVFRARHKKRGHEVAIKILNRVDNRTIKRFEREMQTIRSLQHPNVVTATDAREIEGQHLLVMELLDGHNLSQWLKKIGPFPFAEACEIIRQASLGLMYIHENGLVHRDIKLGNLFLTSTGHVKILDLGLVLLRESDATGSNMTSTGVTMGSIDFMAPEQAEDTHNVDIRADIYSLGATFYTLLAGQLPFTGSVHESPIHKIAALASGKPPNVLKHRSDTPSEICAIVERMMARFPSERYENPAKVVAALTPLATKANLTGFLQSSIRFVPEPLPEPLVAQAKAPTRNAASVQNRWIWMLSIGVGCAVAAAVFAILAALS